MKEVKHLSASAEGRIFHVISGPRKMEEMVLRGATASARRRGAECNVLLPRSPSLEFLADPEVAGALFFLWREEARDFLCQCPYPVINLSNSSGPQAGMGNVLSDDIAVGHLAADFLYERGYRRFLVVSALGTAVHNERAEGFRARVRTRGHEAGHETVSLRYTAAARISPKRYHDFMRRQVEESLSDLPLGCGIFATNDEIAIFIQQILRVHKPEHLDTAGVLGVDNAADQLGYFGQLPALSSIVPAFEEMGAAAMDWLLDHPGPEGKARVQEVDQRFAPAGVVERASTASGACADPLTARVIRWTWARVQAGERVRVADVARAHNLNRKTLERRFGDFAGSTPGDLIVRLRLNKARDLLRSTKLSIAEISEACGYAKQDVLSRALRREVGCTPMEYRRRETEGRPTGRRVRP